VQRAVEAVMRDIGPDPDHGSRLGYYPPTTRETALTYAYRGLSVETRSEQTSTWNWSIGQIRALYRKAPINGDV